MSGVLFIVHKITNYAVWWGTRDGRGRGPFPGEFYINSGANNPNIQLNFSLKPEFSTFFVSTNTDGCLVFNWDRNRYVPNDACLAKMIKDMVDAKARVSAERPLYNLWLAEQNKDLTYDELLIIKNELISELLQLDENENLCHTLGSDGMIRDCLAANLIEKSLALNRLDAINERIIITPPRPGPMPGPQIPPEGITTQNAIIIGTGIAAVIAIAAGIYFSRKKR